LILVSNKPDDLFRAQTQVRSDREELDLKSAPDQVDLQPVVEVEVDSLSAGHSPRTTGENLEHVETLAAAQSPLPPIIVHRPTMRVIDGMHRLRAAKIRGQEKIAVRFFDGDEAEAFVLAVQSNIAHGLPLTLADRKRAAERIIALHPQWSDRRIASVAGIAAGTVVEIRKRTGETATKGLARIGKDGRVRPINGTEGRRLAYELIIEDPTLSLRQIARSAGISPETARDVRNRLRRGEDPLLKGRTKALVGHGQPASWRPGLVRNVAPTKTPPQRPAAVVERLKADPALRFNENGSDLLRLLNIHTIRTEDWNKIIDSVPSHCRGIVAQLARDCAEVWAELAMRIEHNAQKAAT
jgi:ParB-like chromosome segregation protein Spo0J